MSAVGGQWLDECEWQDNRFMEQLKDTLTRVPVTSVHKAPPECVKREREREIFLQPFYSPSPKT